MGKKSHILLLVVVVMTSIIWDSPSLGKEEKPDDKVNLPSIKGLDKGVYLIITVDLKQVMSLQKPKLFMEVSVFETEWTVDEIKSCWVTGIKNCFLKRAVDYVDEFLEFYKTENQEGEKVILVPPE